MTDPREPVFPQEIFDAIIDQLDYKGDFYDCALVSSSFRDRAQQNLFRFVHIVTDQNKETATNARLRETLNNSTRIAAFVESFQVDFMATSPTKYTARAPLVNGLLGFHFALPCLKKLTLRGRVGGIEWNGMAMDLQDRLLSLLRSPVLLCLALKHVEVPFSHIQTLLHLKHLEVYSPDFPQHITQSPPSILPLSRLLSDNGRLETLALIDYRMPRQALLAELRNPSSPLSISHLRGYSTYLSNEDDVKQCQTVLNSSATSLESVSFTVSFASHGSVVLEPYPDLGQLPGLTWLEINVNWGAERSRLWIYRVLETISESNVIDTIIIRAKALPPDIWAQLEQLLILQHRFPKLQRVIVNLPPVLLGECVPQLSAMGRIFKYTPTYYSRIHR